jgi:N-dimethylarginine dimethylaminohydrolase
VNTHLLMCDPGHFRVDYEINPYMRTSVQPDLAAAVAEHAAIVAAHRAAGRTVEFLPADPACPDMVYTANAAVVRGHRAVLANLPPERAAETPHHRAWLVEHGYDVVEPAHLFSGQGDALACGDLLLAGYGQRTDERVHTTLAKHLEYEVVPLRTVSDQWYDLDLAVAVLGPTALAYHPDALDEASRRRLRGLRLDLVEVAADEAARFALNLISDGRTVTMTAGAPRLAGALRGLGLDVVELATTELRKGGGGVRCTALTLDNPPAVGWS